MREGFRGISQPRRSYEQHHVPCGSGGQLEEPHYGGCASKEVAAEARKAHNAKLEEESEVLVMHDSFLIAARIE